MMVFLAAGILYLLGVALILYLKPEYMFTSDGQWKEFGIGQNPELYTAFPFWLFCITWALVSYGIALLLPFNEGQGKSKAFNKNINLSNIYQDSSTTSSTSNLNQSVLKEVFGDDLVGETDFVEKKLKKGIYVLNKRASKLAGVPKYVYIGDDE